MIMQVLSPDQSKLKEFLIIFFYILTLIYLSETKKIKMNKNINKNKIGNNKLALIISHLIKINLSKFYIYFYIFYFKFTLFQRKIFNVS